MLLLLPAHGRYQRNRMMMCATLTLLPYVNMHFHLMPQTWRLNIAMHEGDLKAPSKAQT